MNLDTLLAAVAAHLDSPTLPAVVTYAPEVVLTDLATARVLVAPAYPDGEGPMSEEPVARRRTRFTGRVAVALAAPIGPAPNALADHLAALDTLRVALRNQTLAELPGARWRKQELIAAPSLDHLKAHNLFVGVFHVEYTTNA